MVEVIVDGRRMEGVEVEELGVGQEVQVPISEADLIREFVRRGNVVEVGDVLRHIRCATPVVGHGGDFV